MEVLLYTCGLSSVISSQRNLNFAFLYCAVTVFEDLGETQKLHINVNDVEYCLSH